MEPTPHLSTLAVIALAVHAAICMAVLLRRYPDGLNGPDGMPSFGVTFMVASAIGGSCMAVILTLFVMGEIAFVA